MAQVHQSSLTLDQAKARIAELEAAVARNSKISFKVSENKGALSVYGLGKFPVTLYAGQWERLISQVPAMQAFIAENADKLTRKAA